MNINEISDLSRIGIIKQKQKDFYLIRIKTVAGDMSVEHLKAVAKISEKYADGKVHFTTRQGIEIHNIHVSKVIEAREELEKAGIELGACGPRVRGIMACPGARTCRYGIIDTKELAAELDRKYFREETPGKFKIGVSGCPNDCSKPVENDVGIMGGVLPGWDKEKCTDCGLCVNICPTGAITSDDNGSYYLQVDDCILCGICIINCTGEAWRVDQKGYTLYLGGTMGKKPRLGTRAKALIRNSEDLFRYIDRALEFYKKNGRKKERFGYTMERVGVAESLKEILDEG